MGSAGKDKERVYIAKDIYIYKPDENIVIYDEKNERQMNDCYLYEKVEIYERQVKSWFLDIADKILFPEENMFVVMMILISYIEGIEHIRGENLNKDANEMFINSFSKIFPKYRTEGKQDKFAKENRRKIKNLYDKARCGLYHTGMTKEGLWLTYKKEANLKDEKHEFSIKDPFYFETGKNDNDYYITVNVLMLYEAIKKDFKEYIDKLKSSSEEYKNLRETFDSNYNISFLGGNKTWKI